MARVSSGIYTITSKATGTPVGRNLLEDRSLLPKKVFVLPPDVETPKWELEELPDGNIIMKIGGCLSTAINKSLFAVFQEVLQVQPSTWKISPHFNQGENTYSITLADTQSDGWIVPFDSTPVGGETQIAVQTLIDGPSVYPPNQLFVITPLVY